MSICVPETASALGSPHPVMARWRAAADAALHHTLGRLRALLLSWHQRRRDRSDLRRLPGYLLRDIGLDLEDARQEMCKPFWQA
ncbi:DUF1127 domain-containing protein [Pelagibius sp. CAU 1746]|uniref:DUF1127 domain-containing protein n=1 Tax=Pelagibius sp. CAU 1746 TaxID=3140370 RepID=UPI00325B7E96